MKSTPFTETLKVLLSTENLTNAIANQIILQKFPNKEFIEGKNIKNYYRKLIPYELKELDKKDFKDVLILIDQIYAKLYTSTVTLDSMISIDVRKPITERFGKNSKEHILSKKLVKISYKEKGDMINNAKNKVFKKNSNRTEYETEKIIQVIRDNITSQDPMRRAIALLLACGSRPIEFFEKANYTPIDREWVEQDFIAKKKTKQENLAKPIIYLNSDKFVEEINKVRNELHEKYPNFINAKGQLTSSLATRGNQLIKEMMGGNEFTLYTCRKLYGLLSYDLFGKLPNRYGNNLSYNAWLSNVLGHSKDNLMTSFNYSHLALKNDKITPDELLVKQEVIEQKIENIEERLDLQNYPQEEETPLKPFEIKSPELDKIYSDYIKKYGYKPSQNKIEELGKGIMGQKAIRRYYKFKNGVKNH